MSWTSRSAAFLSALVLAGSGLAVSATPAAAAGGCPEARLCVWDGVDFTGNRIASASTNTCFFINDITVFGSVRSYSNNLPVVAKIWHVKNDEFALARTLPAGGFSSNIGTPLGGAPFDKICLGSALPGSS
ncbi:peptidase inhibitor family I36 protein [Streptomyces sp. NPDC000594]|uniref:peptidase inhibitor family I36 protein n=1 Tax=Streptomyces sp. NPDC000594 TaxID=3154261 RepID=UPI0033249110